MIRNRKSLTEQLKLNRKCKLLIAKALAISLTVALCVSLFSCDDGRGASEIMNEFKDAYGIDAPLYLKVAEEGNFGYTPDGFLDYIYEGAEELVEDFALMLPSGLDFVGECGIFICYSEYDAMMMSELCAARLETIRTLTAGGGLAEDGFILRRGRRVVICALADNPRALRIFDRIL